MRSSCLVSSLAAATGTGAAPATGTGDKGANGSELLGPPGVAPAGGLSSSAVLTGLRLGAVACSKGALERVPAPGLPTSLLQLLSFDAVPRSFGAGCAPVLVGSEALATMAITISGRRTYGHAHWSQTLRSSNQHTYKPDFPPKSTSKETPQTDENLTRRSAWRASLPKPLYLTS